MTSLKRKREEEEEPEEKVLEPSKKKLKLDNKSDVKKAPKKKVCLVTSYFGTKYRGSQMQNQGRGVETIENVLFKAVADAGGMTKVNYTGGPKKVHWSRCSRTDKGVHALFNIFTLKLCLYSDIVERINLQLPDDIYLHGYIRVTASFFPKKHASGRAYEYIIPSFMFARQDRLNNLDVKNLKVEERENFVNSNWGVLDPRYRMNEETFNKVNLLFKNYIGTKFYMNFTKVSKVPNLKSLYRYITKCEISRPFMINDMEFVRINIDGQSFVLNQIRKMIGLVVSVMQGRYEEGIFQTVFSTNNHYRIPRAPALGLYLRKIEFDEYNNRHGRIHGLIQYKNFEESIVRFEERLKVHMYETEVREQLFRKWSVHEHINVATYGIHQEGRN